MVAGSRGPAVFLVVHGWEILKFDCFGFPAGHYHVATPYPFGIRKGLQGRVLFPERTAEEQVERTISSCSRTRSTTCKPTRGGRYATPALDEVRLAEVCAVVKSKMLVDAKHRWEQDTFGKRDNYAAAVIAGSSSRTNRAAASIAAGNCVRATGFANR